MGKWADYLISAVNYDNEHKIAQVKVHSDNSDGVGEEQIVDRGTLALNLKKFSYCTIYGTLDTWKKGEQVKIFRYEEDYFIRTDGNKAGPDNLGHLSDF